MASLKEIAREYRDEIMDGIAWVAIWKTGRSWNAKAFWLNLETERIEDEEMEEAREIVAADPKAIFMDSWWQRKNCRKPAQPVRSGWWRQRNLKRANAS